MGRLSTGIGVRMQSVSKRPISREEFIGELRGGRRDENGRLDFTHRLFSGELSAEATSTFLPIKVRGNFSNSVFADGKAIAVEFYDSIFDNTAYRNWQMVHVTHRDCTAFLPSFENVKFLDNSVIEGTRWTHPEMGGLGFLGIKVNGLEIGDKDSVTDLRTLVGLEPQYSNTGLETIHFTGVVLVTDEQAKLFSEIKRGHPDLEHLWVH